MTDGRDCQRSKLYAWEERFVAPHDASSLTFAQAQGMVDAIWAEMGLRFPPMVERLPGQARAILADANRLSIRLANSSHWMRPASKSITSQSQSSIGRFRGNAGISRIGAGGIWIGPRSGTSVGAEALKETALRNPDA